MTKPKRSSPLVGVAAIPNQCGRCGKFKPWGDLFLHFVPDSDWSSEDESWRECSSCYNKSLIGRPSAHADA